jgi:hypothetical protein
MTLDQFLLLQARRRARANGRVYGARYEIHVDGRHIFTGDRYEHAVKLWKEHGGELRLVEGSDEASDSTNGSAPARTQR